MLSPIPILVYSLTDYRWLTFYIIVLAKLYDNLCKREQEKDNYDDYYETDKEDDYEEEENEEYNEDQEDQQT